MRILHTSDWHLGRTLEGRDRSQEQEDIIQEICDIADEEKVDLVLIAGDVYDTANPPAKAEQLFYQGIYELARGGERAVVVIAGNHDNPERIKAVDPLAERLGITLLGFPKDKPFVSNKETPGVVRLKAGSGWLELGVPGCDHSAVIITLPYPSEQRLKEVLVDRLEDEVLQKSYSEKLGALFHYLAQNFRRESVNLCISHLFVRGGKSSDSERQIDLGGACLVEPDILPPAQYIALGHLHRSQRVAGLKHIRYSGSPLGYSFSEAGQAKVVYVVDCLPGETAEVKEVPLTRGKNLVRWEAREGLPQVIKWCEENRDPNSWIDLMIYVSEPLQFSEIKLLREMRPDIVNIRPVLPEMEQLLQVENRMSLPVDKLFRQFYYHHHQVEPKEELVKLFLELLEEEKEGEDS